MDFGKFYQTSYLDMNGNIVKKSSQSSPNLQPLSRFHRPGEAYTYSAGCLVCIVDTPLFVGVDSVQKHCFGCFLVLTDS